MLVCILVLIKDVFSRALLGICTVTPLRWCFSNVALILDYLPSFARELFLLISRILVFSLAACLYVQLLIAV